MITTKVEKLKGLIISEVTNYFKNTQVKSNEKLTWKYYENICTGIIVSILNKHLPEVTINKKSTREYPEVEFTYDNKLYAIDVKTANNNEKKPAFDLCYLSTYELERFDSYEAEWILSIAYDGDKEMHRSFVDCHFNRLHYLVEKQRNGILSCAGHAVKVRPLSWSDIRNCNFKVKSREELLDLCKKTYLEKNKIEKYRLKMDEQLFRFRNPKVKGKFKTEEGLVDYIFKMSSNLDIEKVRKLIKKRALVS